MTSDEFVGTKNLYTDDSPIIHVGNVEWPKRGTPAKTLEGSESSNDGSNSNLEVDEGESYNVHPSFTKRMRSVYRTKSATVTQMLFSIFYACAAST